MFLTPQEFRKECRSEKFMGHTSGLCKGFAQANLIVLPKSIARDFEGLCLRNPVPCPLLAKISEPTSLDNDSPIVKGDFDIRTDISLYKVYKNGKLYDEKPNILSEWTSEHIGFLIGCSFSFEQELCLAGLTPKHQLLNRNVLMYKTKKLLNPSGVFVNCPYVVSMRPYKVQDIEAVRKITSLFIKTHGEPIDWGYDAVARLGIEDISIPDFGDAITLDEDEVPVFWGCGVTPQAALEMVNVDGISMSHSPGHMLILDITDSEVKQL